MKLLLIICLKIKISSTFAFCQSIGSKQWAFNTLGDVDTTPAIGSDGTIYVGSNNDYFYAINPNSSRKWRFKTGDHVRSTPAIGSDGTIYVGSRNWNLYAINPDGSKKWSFKTGGDVESSPAIGSDGTIYVGSSDENLYAINPDGSKKWAFKTGNWVTSSPAIGSDGTIYAGSDDNNLYAINPNGSKKWSFKTGGWVRSSPAIGSDGTIYVGSHDRNLYAINPDGSKKWAFKTVDWVTSSPAIGIDGTIYTGSDDNNLYAINPDGSEKWSFETGGWVRSSPAIGIDGTIYIGSRDNNLYAINPDGSKKWAFKTRDNVDSSPAIGSDGAIYVGSDDNKVYAIIGSYILSHPKTQDSLIGSSVTLSVKTRDDTDISYQWFKNHIPIEGATGKELVLTSIGESDYAKYHVIIASDSDTEQSMIAEIIPPLPPVIIAEPNSVNADIGDSVTFSVKSVSKIPIDYQWYKNGAAITDGTNEVLTIQNVEKKDYSTYSVRLKNSSGKIVSKVVELLPMGLSTLKPVITKQPKDIVVKTGAVAEFSVGVKGLEPMNYLWYKNGIAISDSNTEKLSIDNFSDDDYGAYSVRIKNNFGKAISNLVAAEKITIKPTLSFKIASQLRVFENEDKLSPSVYNDILYIVNNYHRGGYTQAVDPDGPRLSNTPRNDFGDLYAINNKTGKILWSIELDSPATTSPSVDVNGNVFIATKATTERSGWVDDKDIFKPSKIYCIDNKGKVLWSYELKSNVYSKPAIGNDGTIYFGSDDGYLYAVNTKGVLEWKYRTDGEIRFSPVIGSDGTIYFGSNDNNFFAVNAEGKLILKFKTNNDIKNSAAIGDDGVIYFCTNDTILYALKSDGKIKWELKLFGTGTSGTPAIGSNGIIYAVSDYGIHAVDRSGKELWKRKLNGRYDYNPSIGFENTIVLGNQIFSGTTGKIIKTLPIKKDTILYVYKGLFEWHEYEKQPDIYTGAGTVIGNNGNIYFSDSSFNYFCYKVPEYGIADSSWPMLGANPSRNSNFNSPPREDHIKITSFNSHASPFSLNFETQSDSTYIIEASHDLKKWGEIGEVQGTGSSVKFIERRKALFPKQYYRVKKAE